MPDLRTLNTLHSEKLLGTTLPQGTIGATLVKQEADLQPETRRRSATLDNSCLRKNELKRGMPACPMGR